MHVAYYFEFILCLFFLFFVVVVEIVISNVEEGPEVQNQLLGNATLTQDVFYESNESSEQ